MSVVACGNYRHICEIAKKEGDSDRVDGGHCNTLKSTQYFLKTREKPDRRRIKIEWIEDVIENPIHTEVQSDGRIRKWKKIEEEQKFLRVVLLGNGETVHNAFFDRSFKGKI